ncbi:unnamed protein product [Rhodiola kirilowii]
MQQPRLDHWRDVKRILRYLKGSIDHGIQFKPSSSTDLVAFTDAGWLSDPTDLHSQHGFAVFYGGNLVSWASRKQKVVARSSTEAEYRAIAFGTTEIVWIQQLLKELGISLRNCPVVLCDNLSATFLTTNPVINTRTKHIRLDYYFVREKVDAGELHVRHIPATEQRADVFTKSITGHQFSALRSKLSVFPRPSACREEKKWENKVLWMENRIWMFGVVRLAYLIHKIKFPKRIKPPASVNSHSDFVRMNPTLILSPKLRLAVQGEKLSVAAFSSPRRNVRVRCSSGAELSGNGRLKDALGEAVGEKVEEVLKREENKSMLDELEKASQRVDAARMELAAIEKQEIEARKMKDFVNQLQIRAAEIEECQKEMLQARYKVEEAERALSGGVVEEEEMEVSKNEERLESVKAALIAAVVGTIAGLPIALTRAAEISELILPVGVTFASCALFGVTFRYVVRRDLDDGHLKTGAATAFGVVKGFGTLAGGAPLELNTASFLSHAVDGAIYVSADLFVFLFAAVGLDLCIKMRLLSPFPTKRASSRADIR